MNEQAEHSLRLDTLKEAFQKRTATYRERAAIEADPDANRAAIVAANDAHKLAQKAYNEAAAAAAVSRIALAKTKRHPAATLHEQLIALGMNTTPAGRGKKNILQHGACIFTGRASEVWAWLRKTGRID